ncbi:Uncharacterised protein [Mycobacteroides abscessus subsp. abscessus]|nr:Uncharacterised protein [Mycobacteroides abscessus subsp. abscessus]
MKAIALVQTHQRRGLLVVSAGHHEDEGDVIIGVDVRRAGICGPGPQRGDIFGDGISKFSKTGELAVEFILGGEHCCSTRHRAAEFPRGDIQGIVPGPHRTNVTATS